MSYSKEYIAEVKAAFDASYADYKKDVVARHEKEIQELKQWVTMQKMPTKICGPNLVGILNASGFYKKEPVMNTEDMQEKAAEQYSSKLCEAHGKTMADRAAEVNAAYITEQQQKAYYENMAERQTKELGESMKQTLSEHEYKKNRAAYIEYLLMCVRLGDWHGVSDAANDLRVLEAREKPGG